MGRKKRRADKPTRSSKEKKRGTRTKSPTGSGRPKRSSTQSRRRRDSPDGAEQGRKPRLRSRAPQGDLVGRLIVNRGGFGFVVPQDGGDDVFIGADQMAGAMHGDRVRISWRPSRKGREGRILEVLDRAALEVTGKLRVAAGNQWIDPDDIRLRGPMPIADVPRDVEPGLHVVAEVESFPRYPDEIPETRFVRVLGASGITAVEVEKLKIRDGIVEPFPAEVVEEAEQVPTKISSAERKGRTDFRDLPLLTIDPPDARDHDDAILVEKKKGGYRVIVAIADVSHYVRASTAIDEEAEQRAFTAYLPDRAIPMLPHEISSGMASLVPKKDRLCMAVDLRLNASGEVKKAQFVEGIMRSRARLTYQGVAKELGFSEKPEAQKEASKYRTELEAIAELSAKLRRRRTRRGSLNFELDEPRVELDANNVEPVNVYRAKEDPGIKRAYSMVEEMMLLANEAVAKYMHDKNLPAIYRVHGKPDQEKLALFVKMARSLGHTIDEEEAADPKKLSKFLAKIEKEPESNALNYLLLRAMQQAIYSVHSIGHFALAAPHYLHFTSPIRRYPDLIVHRMLRAHLQRDQETLDAHAEHIARIAFESSQQERKIVALERDVVQLYRCVLVKDRVGETFAATVTGVSERGVFVAFDEPFVEAMIQLERLGGSYQLNEIGTRIRDNLSGTEFVLGQQLKVQLESVNIRERRIYALPEGVARRYASWEDDLEKPEERAPTRRTGDRRGRRDESSGRRQRSRSRQDVMLPTSGQGAAKGKRRNKKKRR